jgi:hypothetical protein
MVIITAAGTRMRAIPMEGARHNQLCSTRKLPSCTVIKSKTLLAAITGIKMLHKFLFHDRNGQEVPASAGCSFQLFLLAPS